MTDRLAIFLRVTWALFEARNKEFYRDRGSLIWSMIFPVCIIGAIGMAFSGDNRGGVFDVGVYSSGPPEDFGHPFLDYPFVKRIDYSDLDQALERMRFHQLDLLLTAREPDVYWINELSPRGLAAEKIYLADGSRILERRAVSGEQVRYVDWVIPGVLGMNMMFGSLFGIGYVIVRYRKNGVLKRIQVTPVTRLQFLTAQVLSRLLVMILSASVVYAGCNLFLDFVMLGSYLDLLLIAVLGSFSMIALSLIIASRTASEELANGLLNLFSFPMMLLSEVWFSLDDAPDWLVLVSQCLPLTHMVQGGRDIMIDGAGLSAISLHLIILALMCVLFLIAAAWLFRWNEQ